MYKTYDVFSVYIWLLGTFSACLTRSTTQNIEYRRKNITYQPLVSWWGTDYRLQITELFHLQTKYLWRSEQHKTILWAWGMLLSWGDICRIQMDLQRENLFENCKITFHLSMRIQFLMHLQTKKLWRWLQKTDADCINKSGGDEGTGESSNKFAKM